MITSSELAVRLTRVLLVLFVRPHLLFSFRPSAGNSPPLQWVHIAGFFWVTTWSGLASNALHTVFILLGLMWAARGKTCGLMFWGVVQLVGVILVGASAAFLLPYLLNFLIARFNELSSEHDRYWLLGISAVVFLSSVVWFALNVRPDSPPSSMSVYYPVSYFSQRSAAILAFRLRRALLVEYSQYEAVEMGECCDEKAAAQPQIYAVPQTAAGTPFVMPQEMLQVF